MKRILIFGVNPFNPVRSRDITTEIFDNHYGGNTGNLVFAHAVGSYLFTPNTQIEYGLYDLFKADVQQSIGSKYDLLILPLANHISRVLKEELEQLTKLVLAANIPTVVVGIGAQSTYDYCTSFLSGLEPTIKAFFSAVLDKSDSVAVRGEFTAHTLQLLGFGNHVRVTGCPSFFYRRKNFQLRSLPADVTNQSIVFNIAPEMEALFNSLSEQCKIPCSFVTQYLPDAHRMGPHMYQWLAQGRMHFFGDFDTWSHFQAARPFTISGRIHGSIISLLAGTPVFLLASDSRTREMAELFSIPFAHFSQPTNPPSLVDIAEKSDCSATLMSYPDRLATFECFLNENRLPHNLTGHEPPEFIARTSLNEEHPNTVLRISKDDVVAAMLERLNRLECSMHHHAIELNSRTTIGSIIKRSIGGALGVPNVSRLKKIFGLHKKS